MVLEHIQDGEGTGPAGARADFPISDPIIDRSGLTADQADLLDRVYRQSIPQMWKPEDLERFGDWMYGLMLAFHQNRGRRHVPDPPLVAQFLAVATTEELEQFLTQLQTKEIALHKPRKYGWFVTVALNRLRGVPCQTAEEFRKRLRAMAGGKPKSKPQPFEAAIRTAAAAKKMG